MAIEEGSKICLEYTGTLDDGVVFDSTEGKSPMKFEMKPGSLIKGFYDALIGMNSGDEKTFRLEPKDAYGERDDRLLDEIPRDKFPKDPVPEPGMMFYGETEKGQRIPTLVVKVTDEIVTIDMNHPMAGKALNFKIKVVSVD
ncbi:FKBP-type peptidyl-prolyl cis-trans isomerase [Candidatus Lokiarchaeum ossiferum]|uniref:Peptidyl-prolyl cis-trans isomerase n=1 Tax=Candidatus Lokiarchaeum ossiferum TaxID=2951803 RepID=A0ABY6HN58_9ARCH|nr:FKBP-type peptidyl-prolyl cis-trans isomerase [Candidatus Lokiarchaeum sp. B-35]